MSRTATIRALHGLSNRRPGRPSASFSQRDWDRFIRARRAGKAGGSGKPGSDRTIASDLRFLLKSNPLRGLKLPRRKTRDEWCSPSGVRALLRGGLADLIASSPPGLRSLETSPPWQQCHGYRIDERTAASRDLNAMAGGELDDLLDDHPTVSRAQAVALPTRVTARLAGDDG